MSFFRRLVLIPIFAISVRAADEEGVVFRQQYQPGYHYHQTSTMAQEMDLDLGGQTMDQRMSMSVGLDSLVAPGSVNGSKAVTVKYDRAVASISAQGQKFSFDSQNPDAANAGPLVGLMRVVGNSFRVNFDSDDHVTGIENLDNAVNALSGTDPIGSEMFRELFNQESVKRMLQQSVLRSPNARPMRVGEGWPFTNELKLPGIGKLQIKGEYTFVNMVERDGVSCAEVRAMAEISLDASDAAGASDENANVVQQMKMKLEQGKLQGTIYYDPAIRFSRAVEIEQRLTLTAVVPDGTGKVLRLPMKQVIGMKLDKFEPIKSNTPEPEDE